MEEAMDKDAALVYLTILKYLVLEDKIRLAWMTDEGRVTTLRFVETE
jgi:hypothetical protein